MTSEPFRFLVVDDDEVDVMNIRRELEKNRVANPLLVANDGLDALSKLRSGEIPLDSLIVLLDLNMPRMSGVDFLREVRQDPRLSETTVVVLTTSAEENAVVEGHQLNVAGYLRKPVDFNEFTEIMRGLDKYWTVS